MSTEGSLFVAWRPMIGHFVLGSLGWMSSTIAFYYQDGWLSRRIERMSNWRLAAWLVALGLTSSMKPSSRDPGLWFHSCSSWYACSAMYFECSVATALHRPWSVWAHQDYGEASFNDLVGHNSRAVMIPSPNTKTMIVRNGRRATSVCRTERSGKFHSVAFQFSVEPTMNLLSKSGSKQHHT